MIADDADVEPAPAAEPLSTITTERPAFASSKATAPPMTPAPITTASVFTDLPLPRVARLQYQQRY